MTDLPPLETEPRSAEAPGPSDAELITAVRSGDKAAFGPLYLRHVGAALAGLRPAVDLVTALRGGHVM